MKNEKLHDFVRWAIKIDWSGLHSSRTASGNRWQLERIFLNPPFQIERVTVSGQTFVPLHRHPNVDSYEFYGSGGGILQVSDRHFDVGERYRGIPISIPHDAWHGAEVKPGGIIFYSMQFWHCENMAPVTSDWEGEIDWKNAEKIAVPLDRP